MHQEIEPLAQLRKVVLDPNLRLDARDSEMRHHQLSNLIGDAGGRWLAASPSN
jgi:hypothetical protein